MLVWNASKGRRGSRTLVFVATTLAFLAPCRPAQAAAPGGCTARLVDDKCQPHSGVFDDGDTMRVATVCEFTSTASPPKPPTLYPPTRPDLAQMTLARSGCKYPVKVELKRTEDRCGPAVVYELELEKQGRYTFFGQRLTVGDPDPDDQPPPEESYGGFPDDGFGGACPAPPEDILAQIQAKAELERQERESAAIPTKCRRIGASTDPDCLPKEKTFWEATDWDDTAREGWSVELAAAPVVRSVFGLGLEGSFVGSEVRIGFRRTHDYSARGTEGLRWCMPVAACMLLGIFAPASSWVGNEHGLDLVVGLGQQFDPRGDSVGGSIALRPILRVAAHNRFRSQSWVGSLLPEVGLRFADSREPDLFLGWSIYPVDIRLGRNLAVGFDGPVISPSFPLDGTPMRFWIGTGLSLSVLAGER